MRLKQLQHISKPYYYTAMDAALSAEESSAGKKKKVRTDYHLWGTYISLTLIGIVELFSASIQKVQNNIFEPIIGQGVFILMGLVIMLILQSIDYRRIFAAIPVFVMLCIAAEIGVLCAGEAGQFNDAQRALQIAGIKVIPADMMKLGVALGLAWILARTQDRSVKGRHDVTYGGLWGCVLFLGISVALLISDGLSNTIIVCSIGFSMMIVGGMSWKKIGIAFLVFSVLGGGVIVYKTQAKMTPEQTAYAERVAELNQEDMEEALGQGRGTSWRERLKRHFRSDKAKEPFSTGENNQEQLSYIAQAHGGFFGVGIGRSRENARLPLAHIDYVYAVIIEELGAIIGILILVAYLWILGRSAKLTVMFKPLVPKLLAMGCAFTIVFQALYHIAIVTGVFPVSGQPLPMISRGGVSVLATSIAFGIMLSVARHAVRINDGPQPTAAGSRQAAATDTE